MSEQISECHSQVIDYLKKGDTVYILNMLIQWKIWA